jgi:hypothetical protein
MADRIIERFVYRFTENDEKYIQGNSVLQWKSNIVKIYSLGWINIIQFRKQYEFSSSLSLQSFCKCSFLCPGLFMLIKMFEKYNEDR